MKQLGNKPWDGKSYTGGANSDTEREHLARGDSGQYEDARNMRMSSRDGQDGSLIKIGGEVLFYPAQELGANTYVCVGTILILGKQFSIWASSDPANYPPFISINGVTKVKSPLLPYVYDRMLQLAKSEDCEGGLVFDARSGQPPIVWDLSDIESAFAAGLDTYFAGFTLSQVTANLTTPLNRPKFRGFVSVGPGNGHKPGQVTYAIRFASDSGDKTAVGPETPMIAIPKHYGDQTNFHGQPLVGASPLDIGQRTEHGIKLRWRVNNVANFERVEVIRYEYNLGAGLDSVAAAFVVYQQAVQPGEIVNISWTDNGDFITALTEDQTQEQRFYILSANAVRYINYRVVYANITVASRDLQLEFTEVGGSRVFPFTKNIGQRGHTDPFHQCYSKSLTRDERYGFGIVGRDAAGGLTLVSPIVDNWQAPSRRDEKTGAALTYSDSPLWACTVNHEVKPTFEVIDHDAATRKQNDYRFVNIMVEGTRYRDNQDVPDNPSVPSSFGFPEGGLYEDGVGLKTSFLKPLRPVGPLDADAFGLDYLVNTHVKNSAGAPYQSYAPAIHNPNYHALGIGIHGITGGLTEGYIQGFHVVRTKPANRVSFQALARWVMVERDGDLPAGKQTYRIALSIPDLDSGLIGQEIIERFIDEPGDFRLKGVSPQAITTENYSSVVAKRVLNNSQPYDNVSIGADLLTTVRGLWDNGQINPGTPSGGITPTQVIPNSTYGINQDHYVDFTTWRNTPNANNPFAGPNGGNAELVIDSVTQVIEPSGARWFSLEMNQQFYFGATPSDTSQSFDDPLNKEFHEPWFVVNIVQNLDADPLLGYEAMSHYQMLKCVIGLSTGLPDQVFEIIDERLDDVINVLPTDLRYLHFILPDGSHQAYMGFNNSNQDFTQVYADIAANGFWVAPDGMNVYGVYFLTGTQEEPFLNMSPLTPPPPAGARAEIWYDNRAPIRSLGGESMCAPSMVTVRDGASKCMVGSLPADNGAPLKYLARANVTVSGPELKLNATPIPYAWHKFNPRYYVPFGRCAPTATDYRFAVNQLESGKIVTVRQWKALFDCEIRCPLHLSAFDTTDMSTFPNIHYVPRPRNFYDDDSFTTVGVFQDGYTSEYPNETTTDWYYGGFKNRYQVDLDYAVTRGVQFFRKPAFGFRERTHLCNAVIWSPRVSPLLQDVSAFRTFPTTNIYFVENDTGDIERLYSSRSESSGYNLYGFTSHGTFMLLTDKSIAYSADGSTFGLIKQDNFIGGNANPEVWLSKHIGMPGEQWRTAAEGNTFLSQNNVRSEMIGWDDGQTTYVLSNNTILDIAKGTYRLAMHPPNVRLSPRTAVFDMGNDELWIAQNRTLYARAFSPGVQGWNGQYDYDFDQYLCVDSVMYGMRRGATYRLDQGWTINGAPITASVMNVSGKSPMRRMEFDRIKLDCYPKPTRVEFYNDQGVFKCALDPTIPTQGALYMKNEDAWAEAFIPRENLVQIGVKRKRIQGRLMHFKVIHSDPTSFRLTSSSIQFKLIN